MHLTPNGPPVFMADYKPIQNTHILSCMLRFRIGLRLALGRDLLFLRPL